MLHYVQQLTTNFVCLPLCVRQVLAYGQFFQSFLLWLEMMLMRAVRLEENSKAGRRKRNTMSYEMLKSSIELKAAAELVMIHAGFVLRSTPFTLHI